MDHSAAESAVGEQEGVSWRVPDWSGTWFEPKKLQKSRLEAKSLQKTGYFLKVLLMDYKSCESQKNRSYTAYLYSTLGSTL